jgi:hypothetical protein
VITTFLLLENWYLGGAPPKVPGVRVLAASSLSNHFLVFAMTSAIVRLRAGMGARRVLGCRRDVSVKQLARAEVIRRAPAGAATFLRLEAGAAMSITSNLSFFRGEDITLQFQMSPPNTDITGWTITFKIATNLGGTVQITKTATVLDGPRGVFQVSIANTDTATLTVGRYVWDCRRTDTGNRATLADGYLDLRQEVTA